MNTVLPQPITEYLAAHQVHDAGRTLPLFAPDAVVADDGHTYRGHAEIRGWLGRAASEFTFTTTLLDTEQVDDDHYVTTHHLEGDFPGGAVDLHFRFTLHAGLITHLVIEP
ncbi:nuclear transport factor 2 family protein [Amycolatopsis rhabdoformis]|uniref:Nuclear transport factor 2 family protein n=1 Tax=Amycolatopsis rhabdoformis TaxID=1448059 RepID=A0ABZ1IL71_9PSEU|nr:nuclear transport factor 2 family protein [Amycolatopsis rhabdoformis]WSE34616.1 nuclear transport factor 2 family protein [Amycolatopsis rhabdoformis]